MSVRYEFWCMKCDVTFEKDMKLCDVDRPVCVSCNDNQTKKCLTSPSFSINGFNAKNNYGLKG